MKGAQAGKPCVSINPIWQTWQANGGAGWIQCSRAFRNAARRRALASGKPWAARAASTFATRAARLSPPCAAASSSTVQNSASSATEVACPASRKERLIRWRGTLCPQSSISYCAEALTFCSWEALPQQVMSAGRGAESCLIESLPDSLYFAIS